MVTAYMHNKMCTWHLLLWVSKIIGYDIMQGVRAVSSSKWLYHASTQLAVHTGQECRDVFHECQVGLLFDHRQSMQMFHEDHEA